MYENQKILYEDYSHLSSGELVGLLYQTIPYFQESNDPILVLCNYENATVNRLFLDEIIRLTKEYDQKIAKSASFGLTNTQMVISEVFLEANQGFDKHKYFDNKENALKFLVELE